MSARAYAEYDPTRFGVRMAVSPREGQYYKWQAPDVALDEETVQPDPDAWLRLTQDEARAIYEALGEYFGGNVADSRMLRKDYEAERARVDRLIEMVTKK